MDTPVIIKRRATKKRQSGRRSSGSGEKQRPVKKPRINEDRTNRTLKITIKLPVAPLIEVPLGEPEIDGADTPLRPSGKTSDWDEFLSDEKNLLFIPPVTMFKYAPLANIWKDFAEPGRVFEVANPFIRCSRPVNWFATVVHFAGYKALIEFECFGVIPKFMAWMSYCSDVPKQIGYSDKNRIVLYPPHEVKEEHPDFLDKIREVLWSDSRITISNTHGADVEAALRQSQKYPIDTKLEVLDKSDISRMRIATVTALVGDRIHVSYVIEPKPNDLGFWFNVNSDLVHPLGWSQTVEHDIFGVPKFVKFIPIDKEYFPIYPDNVKVSRGQWLEVRHPGKLKTICAAIVHRVLKYGYFVAEIKVLPAEVNTSTRFTYHITSPYVFYSGFSAKHGIKLVAPYGENPDTFNWTSYQRRTNVTLVPLQILPERPTNRFKPGMKMEAVDPTHPFYLGPCTVLKTVAHLLYIHFDGWTREKSTESDAEMWIDAESPDIYPIGFAEMVGHEFQSCVDPVNPIDLVQNGDAYANIEIEMQGIEEGSNIDEEFETDSD